MTQCLIDQRILLYSKSTLFLLLLAMGFYIPSEKTAAVADDDAEPRRYPANILGPMMATTFILLSKIVLSVFGEYSSFIFGSSVDRFIHGLSYGTLMASLPFVIYASLVGSSQSTVVVDGVPVDDMSRWAQSFLLVTICIFVALYSPICYTNPVLVFFGLLFAAIVCWMDYYVSNPRLSDANMVSASAV